MKAIRRKIRNSISIGIVGSILVTGALLATRIGEASGIWTTKAPINSARYQNEAAVVNGVLYTAGGWNVCTPYSTLEAYDPVNNAWISRAPMSVARGAFGIGSLNGTLYAVGGAVGCGVGTSSVEAYDPVTNTWSPRAPLPTARYGHMVAVANGKLYAIGGGFSNGPGYFSSMTEYDPASNTWTERTPMPTPRYTGATAVINNMIYVIGGGNYLNGSLTTVEVYDTATDTWTTKAPLPVGRPGLGAAVVSGKDIYAIGGQGSCTGLSNVDIYDITTDSWSTGTSLPAPRYNFGTGFLNGSIYVIGGYVQYDCGSNQGSVSSVVSMTVNTLPTISGASVTVPNSSSSNVQIATVDDAEDGASGPSVSVTSSNPSNGVTISNIVNNNGVITADVSTSSNVGPTAFTLMVTDSSGATATATLNVTSVYDFRGFFQPVDNLPTVNSVNAGQAVPIKFSLTGAQGLDIFAPGYPVSGQVACTANAVSDVTETVAAGSSSLSYDPATDQYTYVWKTSRTWKGTCRLLIVRLNDGSNAKVVSFKFK